MLDLKAQYAGMKGEIDAAIARVLESQFFILGPEVEALEKEIAAYSQTAHGIGVSSGTDAILVALMALGVGPGDEVVTTPYTFLATATCIGRLGAKARFVDIDPVTFNVDEGAMLAAIGPKTQALMPVHLYGQMADVARLKAGTTLPIIEDAAQAIGAERDGQRAGSIGALGCLSFFPSKNLGAYGDGGMVLAEDAALADRVKLLRNQGQRPKYYSLAVSGNFRLDALQAAILRAKLPHLDAWTAARQRNADVYRGLFRGSKLRVVDGPLAGDAQVGLPVALPGARHIYNQFVVRTQARDALRDALAQAGIATEIYYPQPMHLQKCFEGWGYQKGEFPESERAAEETFGLPIYPELTTAQMERVVGVIEAFFAGR
jgi:dTDP-4-amino-4,6-dideoxygalactose transaminase